MISVHVLSVKNNNLMRFAVHNIKKNIEALYNFSKKKIPGHFHGIIDQKFNTSTFAFLNKNVKQTSLYIIKNLSCSSQGTQPCFYSTQKLKFKVVQNTTTLKYKFLNPRSRYDLFKVHQM